MEGSELHPARDEGGRYRFDPAEVRQVARERDRRDAPGAIPEDGDGLTSTEGEFAARGFALFADGAGPAQVVIALRRPPAEVRALHNEYLALTGTVALDRVKVQELGRAIGRPITGSDDLWSVLCAALTVCADRRALTYPCDVCGEPIEIGPDELPDIRAALRDAGWGHELCQRG